MISRTPSQISRTSSEYDTPCKQVKLLLLHCVGEIGKEVDLSAFNVETVIVTSFTSGGEDTKSAASHALGSIAGGAMSKYLPYILSEIQNQAEFRWGCPCWRTSLFYALNLQRSTLLLLP